MPVIKNREDRLQTINARLNRWNGRPASTDELAGLCQVSHSAIKQDIAYLKECREAPIQYDRKRKGYYYTQPFNLAATISLTDQDVVRLNTAVATLTQFQHLTLFDGLRGTVDKIEKAVRFRAGTAHSPRQVLLFESVPFSKGSEWLAVFLQAIGQSCMVTFVHQRYETEQRKTHQLIPYVLKEHRNRWYVVGWHVAYASIRVFGLDRIVEGSVSLADERAEAPAFDAETYFRQALGVAVYEQPAEEVVLTFTRKQGLHYRAQPFFALQTSDILADTETEFRIRLTVIINDELVYELARMGPEVYVVAPVSLQQKLVAYLKATRQQYE